MDGITFGEQVAISLTGGSGHTVILDGDTIRETGADNLTDRDGLLVEAHVPSTVSVTHSTIRDTAPATPVMLRAGNTSGLVTFHLIGDRITAHGSTTAFGGVRICACGDGGTVYAGIYNDSVWDVHCESCLVGLGVTHRPSG